ncbi:hypothetical protein [Natrinema soli]|nr:hypothetical protein [Natrinema soli]
MIFPLLFLTGLAGYSLAQGLSMIGWEFLVILWLYALVEVVSGIFEVSDR